MPLDMEQEVLFTDGSWDLVIVRSQADGSSGGQRVLLRWYQDVSEHEGWYLIRTSSNRDKFRELPPELGRGHSQLASRPSAGPATRAASAATRAPSLTLTVVRVAAFCPIPRQSPF